MVRKLAVTLVAAFALVAASVAVPAHAAPVAHPDANQPEYHHKYTIKLSKIEKSAAVRAGKINAATKGKTLDYRVAKKYYKGSAHPHNWPRQFAAGVLAAHGHISHISSKELSKVKHIERSLFAAPRCTGKSGASVLLTYWYPIRVRLNSCQTNIAIDIAEGCIPLAGAGIVFDPGIVGKAAVVTAMVECGLNLVMLKLAKDVSPLGAVTLRIEIPGKPISAFAQVPIIIYAQY